MSLLPRPSETNQRRLTRLMQVLLVGIVIYGVVAGQKKAITNGVIALFVTFLPARLEHNYEFPIDPWLGLWITGAVFLHTLGSAGFYGAIPWWDHLTHATSASLVAGVGYTAARALDLHSEQIMIPHRFAFAYILIVVLSFGVLWELFEFGLDAISDATGVTMPLAQQGLDDTVRDLMFNSVGALLVALFGQVYLGPVAESVRVRFLDE